MKQPLETYLENLTKRELFNYLRETDERNQRNMDTLFGIVSQTISLISDVVKKM